jgi:hypothetical protein
MPNSPLCLLLDTSVWLEKYLPWRSQRRAVLSLLHEARLQDIALTDYVLAWLKTIKR